MNLHTLIFFRNYFKVISTEPQDDLLSCWFLCCCYFFLCQPQEIGTKTTQIRDPAKNVWHRFLFTSPTSSAFEILYVQEMLLKVDTLRLSGDVH